MYAVILLPITFGLVLFGGLSRYRISPSLRIYGTIILFFLLSSIITFRGTWMPDYENYATAYYHGKTYKDATSLEAMFDFIRRLTIDFNNPLSLFAIYATITVYTILSAIRQQSRFIFLSLAIWISYIFIVQDMIQIRQGAAAALFLYSCKYINSRKLVPYIALNFLGSLFHLSALAVLPLYFIGTQCTQRWLYLSLIPLAYLVYYSHFGTIALMLYIPFDYITYQLTAKAETLEATQINIFNYRQIIEQLICIVLWLNINRIRLLWPQVLPYIKIFTLSVVIFIVFFDIPDIAARLSVLYATTEIIAIPSLIYSTYRFSMIARMSVGVISLMFFVNYYISYCIP